MNKFISRGNLPPCQTLFLGENGKYHYLAVIGKKLQMSIRKAGKKLQVCFFTFFYFRIVEAGDLNPLLKGELHVFS